MLFVFSSCNNEEETLDNNIKQEYVLKSNLTEDNLSDIINFFNDMPQFAPGSPFSVSETAAREVLTPLIQDGSQIQQQMLEQVLLNDYEYTAEDITLIKSLTEEQLAELSLTIYAINYDLAIMNLENDIQYASVVDCLINALGLSGLNDIIAGGAAAVTAKTGLQIIKAVGRQAFGYITLAWAIISFLDCIND